MGNGNQPPFREVGKTNVSIEYIIKDFEGNSLFEDDEIVEVETQVSFSKIIQLPSTIKIEDYVAIVQARYADSLGSSSDIFHIIEKEEEVASAINNAGGQATICKIDYDGARKEK